MSQQGHSTPPLSENAYTYNGKELTPDFGIALHDYGARQYDAANGRWTGIDPLAEKYAAWSPYNYVLGNPLKFIDPDGRNADIVIKKGNPNAKNEEDRRNSITVTSTIHWSPDSKRAYERHGIKNAYTENSDWMKEAKNLWENVNSNIEVDGVQYDVHIKIKIETHETHDEAAQAWAEDRSSTFLLVNEAYSTSNAGGTDESNRITLSLDAARKKDGVSFSHEVGHTLGLGHNYYKDEKGRVTLMSDAPSDYGKRALLDRDIGYVVSNAVDLANKQGNEVTETRLLLIAQSTPSTNTFVVKGGSNNGQKHVYPIPDNIKK